MSSDTGHPILKGALLPAAATAAGMMGGSLMGGTAAKALIDSRGIQQFLRRATPAQKAKLLNRIRIGTTALGGAAGAGVGGISYKVLEGELKKLEQDKSSEKTAMFLVCLEHIGELHE